MGLLGMLVWWWIDCFKVKVQGGVGTLLLLPFSPSVPHEGIAGIGVHSSRTRDLGGV
jgi:hypothetical protein